MDAFYASVEERDRPELVGKPVIVGGSAEKRGVVSAANYVARKFGVHSAMPSVTAHRLCPQGIYLPPRIDYYAEVSKQIRDIFERFTPLVEPLSLDEAFLDVTGSESLFGPAVEIGRKIKQAIREELRLVVSVGVAPNKFLAKIASDLKKPDALVVVEPDKVQEFLDPLPIERLWRVGKQSSMVFQQLGIRTIASFASRRSIRSRPALAAQASSSGTWPTAATSEPWSRSGRQSRSPTRPPSSTTSPTWTCCGPGWWTLSTRWAADCGSTHCGAGQYI
jgi:DNA polymerase-4